MSNVDELRQALGTSVEAPAKKVFRESAPQEESIQEKIVTEDTSTDELVYTDSSTFLKVSRSKNIKAWYILSIQPYLTLYCKQEAPGYKNLLLTQNQNTPLLCVSPYKNMVPNLKVPLNATNKKLSLKI